VSDYLKARGWKVLHIMAADNAKEHPYTSPHVLKAIMFFILMNSTSNLNNLTMQALFNIGDNVIWNYEGGRSSGKIIKIHTEDLDYKGDTHHATEADPQYEIKNHMSHPIAVRKGTGLTKIIKYMD
jgi:uncharacterized protein (DUF488 family)